MYFVLVVGDVFPKEGKLELGHAVHLVIRLLSPATPGYKARASSCPELGGPRAAYSSKPHSWGCCTRFMHWKTEAHS